MTAAAPDVPAALQEQLKTGGRLVIPIGSPLGAQTLYVAQKDADGRLARRAGARSAIRADDWRKLEPPLFGERGLRSSGVPANVTFQRQLALSPIVRGSVQNRGRPP